MPQELLSKIVTCPTLPSLPGVAIEVLELTRDPQVPIALLAKTVENDQALAAKILKTINSSFYGLTKPCPTITRAVGYLGLNTVKSLVLSLSVLDTFRQENEPPGIRQMWQRAVYSASGARSIARRAGTVDPDEAFICGLLQDIGMLAMIAALGSDYIAHVRRAGESHEALPEIEQGAYELDHAEVGRRLAESWKLPEELCRVIGQHHDPPAANDAPMLEMTRLATAASAALCTPDDRSAPGRFRALAARVLALPDDEAVDLLGEVSTQGAELSRLFRTDPGRKVDPRALMAEASDQLIAHQISVERERADMLAANQDLAEKVITDGLTRTFNRGHFDATLPRELEGARKASRPLAVILGDADHFKSVNDEHGHSAGDAILVELARRIKEGVGPDGLVFRYGGEEFAAVLPSMSRSDAGRVAERVRRLVEATPFDLAGVECEPDELRVTMSLGVAAYEPATNADALSAPAQLLAAADRAVYAAKHAGRNCVRVFAPKADAPAARVPSPGAGVASAAPASDGPAGSFVLILEDDPLHAQVIAMHLSGVAGVTTRHVGTAEDAIWCLRSGGRRPDVVITDLRLPGMGGIDLIRTVRDGGWTMPIIALSSSSEPEEADRALQAGATTFLTKSDFATDASVLVAQVLAARRGALAA